MRSPFPRPAYYALALTIILTLAHASNTLPPAGRAKRFRVPPTDPGPLHPTCHGRLHTQAQPNGANPSIYADLTDWCVHGPQHCECVDDPYVHRYVLYCTWETSDSSTANRCFNACLCEAHENQRYLDALARMLPPSNNPRGAIA